MDGRLLREEEGFALVESMVAAVILVAGLLTLMTMLTMATTTTASTKTREQGVALQRELVEAVRGIPYDALSPNSVVAAVQAAAAAGLSDSSSEIGWTVKRRGIDYTLSLGVCSVDDPADGLGAHDAATFCASGPGTTTREACHEILGVDGTVVTDGLSGAAAASIGDCGIDVDANGTVDGLLEADLGLCLPSCPPPGGSGDASPDDYKRLVTLVRWEQGKGARYALQSATIPNPGLASAPVVLSVSSGAGAEITSGTSVAMSATIDREPATVGWLVDGAPAATSGSGSGTSWGWTWPLGSVSAGSSPSSTEVLDGSYVVGAKAFDAYGTASQARSITLRVNRRRPFAPARFQAGRNGTAVDLEWSAAPERDVEGHRVYRDVLLGTDVLVCGLERRTSCRDASPPAGIPSYYAVAVDRDPAGVLREGDPSASDAAGLTLTPPGAPGGLGATAVEDDVVLTWTAASGSVDHYRIYRDGTAYGDRYDRTSGTELTFTDTATNGLAHTYAVSAVDADLAESAKAGPVSP